MPDQASGLLSTFLRARRIRVALPHIAGTVLDFGCGAGALAERIGSAEYVGVDQDLDSIALARDRHRQHEFHIATEFEHTGRQFDSVVALAVVEHVPDVVEFLGRLRTRLLPGGRIVLTTPHPGWRRIHAWGARIGLFSRGAAAEHHEFLGRARLEACAASASLHVELYKKFLLGANQLFVLRAE